MQSVVHLAIGATSLILLSVLLGAYTWSYDILRWSVFLTCLTVAFISYRKREYTWLAIFFLTAIIFEPIFQFLTLSRDFWQILDVIVLCLFFFFLWDQYNRNYQTGIRFEKYLQSLFPQDAWVIEDRTKDLSKKLRRFVESDTYPDFTFRHIRTGKRVAIECKYHTDFYTGKYGDQGVWWRRDQGERYRAYGVRQELPVYVALGIGGGPLKPERLFLCPLDILNTTPHGFVTETILTKFEKKPDIQFTPQSLT